MISEERIAELALLLSPIKFVGANVSQRYPQGEDVIRQAVRETQEAAANACYADGCLACSRLIREATKEV